VSVLTDSRLISIESEAFSNAGLTTVDLPATLQHLGDHTFEGCGSLVNVNITGLASSAYSSSEAVVVERQRVKG